MVFRWWADSGPTLYAGWVIPGAPNIWLLKTAPPISDSAECVECAVQFYGSRNNGLFKHAITDEPLHESYFSTELTCVVCIQKNRLSATVLLST